MRARKARCLQMFVGSEKYFVNACSTVADHLLLESFGICPLLSEYPLLSWWPYLVFVCVIICTSEDCSHHVLRF